MKKTIGQLIDELSIVNIKIWMAEDVKRDKDATDKQIADATRKTNIANQQRNDLIQVKSASRLSPPAYKALEIDEKVFHN